MGVLSQPAAGRVSFCLLTSAWCRGRWPTVPAKGRLRRGRRVFLPPLLAVQFDDILAPGLTTIFPTMRGWIEQKYSYSPGAEKV